MVKNCTEPGANEDAPRKIPEGFGGLPTAARQLAAVEKISVNVMVPYLQEKTQDFDSVQVHVRLKVDPGQHITDSTGTIPVGKNRSPAPDSNGWKSSPDLEDRLPVGGVR